MTIPIDPTNIRTLYIDARKRADRDGLTDRLGPDGWFMMGFVVAAKQSEYDNDTAVSDMAEKITNELMRKLAGT